MTDVILAVSVGGGVLACLLCVVIALLGAIFVQRSRVNRAEHEKSSQAKTPEDAMENGVPMQSPQPTPDTADAMDDREATPDAQEKGQAKTPGDAMEKGVPMQSPQPTPDTADVMDDQEATPDAPEKGHAGALPPATQLPAPASLRAGLPALASILEDTLPAGAVMLTDERQLYINPEGWAAVAPEGAASNTDAARRTWAMDETSRVLSLPDGRQLYVNREGRAGAAPEGANTNTDPARRCLRPTAGIFSLADGRQLYVKANADVGADVEGAGENVEDGRRVWASTATLQVSPDAALRAAMSGGHGRTQALAGRGKQWASGNEWQS